MWSGQNIVCIQDKQAKKIQDHCRVFSEKTDLMKFPFRQNIYEKKDENGEYFKVYIS